MAQPGSIAAHPTVRQFVKFCIIGFSSMIIDVGIWKVMMNRYGWHWVSAQTLSFAVAVTNGFIWNSYWTFRGLGSGKRHELYARFVGLNVIGYLLNIAIMKAILVALTGQVIHDGKHENTHLNIAKAFAILCVAFWNFFSNKKWTFTAPKPEEN